MHLDDTTVYLCTLRLGVADKLFNCKVMSIQGMFDSDVMRDMHVFNFDACNFMFLCLRIPLKRRWCISRGLVTYI